MLKGDLAAAPPGEVLALLADGSASGCLHLRSPDGRAARVYLRSGRIYAVQTPGDLPDLGGRLVSRGLLAPEALAEAVEAQHSELQGWRLAELLVHLGFVDQAVVDAFMSEQLRDGLTELLSWTTGTWKLRLNERTRDDVAPAATVAELLADVEARRSTWTQIARAVHGPAAVPMLSAAGRSDEQLEIDPDAWSLLCKVDGVRTVAELARDSGLSLYEAGQVVYLLLGAGLIDVEAPVGEPDGDLADQLPPADGPAAAAADAWPVDLTARLTGALTRRPAPVPVPPQGSAPVGEDLRSEAVPRHLEPAADDEVVSGSIQRVSEALSVMLGPATADDDMFSAPLHRPARTPAPAPPQDPKRAERSRREAHRRARDAEELAAAQADLEAGRAAEQVRRTDLLPADHVADVVDLQQVRLEAEAAEAARLEAVWLAEQAHLEEQVRRDAEAVEQKRLAAEAAAAAELARREAEAEAEAELERLAAAEAAATAELARREAEAEAEAEAELERLAAAEAAAAAEQARLQEQARRDAEAAEQARLAEQLRLEEEAWLAAEAAEYARAAKEAHLTEQARLAAEAAEQARQEEVTRLTRLAEAEADAEADAAVALRGQQDSWFAAASREQVVAAEPNSDWDPDLARFSAETHAAALAELSASASLDLAPPAQSVVAPEPVDVRPDDYDYGHDDPMPVYGSSDTDTAALLRELSSLGLDDEPPPAAANRPARPAAPRPASLAAQKKRKGLFGRG